MQKMLMVTAGILILLSSGSLLAFEPLFDTRVDYAVGESPYSLSLVDLDGDSDLDIVTAASYDWIFFLENDGEGGYTKVDSLTFSKRAKCVATGDLDGDGDFDIAVGGQNDSVYIVENQGGWNFQTISAHGYGSTLFTADIMAVDIDNDADLDVVSCYRDYVCILRNNGDATFGAIRKYYSKYSEALSSADFDADGDIDIAVANTYDNNFAIMLNDADTTFVLQAGIFYNRPYDVFAAKIDTDNDYDLIVVGNGKASVYFNNGDATFTLDSAYSASDLYSGKVTGGDLDGDGDIDFAWADDQLGIFINQGDGSYGEITEYMCGSEGVSVQMGTIDSDGDVDLAIGNHYGTIAIMPNNGDGTFPVEPRIEIGDYSAALCAGNFNGDVYTDFAVSNTSDEFVSVFISNGDKTFQDTVNYAVGYSAYSMTAADLNGDNYDDIIVADSALTVMINNGDGTFAPGVPYHCSAINYIEFSQQIKAGDIDGDGNIDVAVASYYDVKLFYGNGDGTLQPAAVHALGYEPSTVDIADFNHDGINDLVLGDYGDEYVRVALNNGDSTFAAPIELECPTSPITVTVGDFNGDGWDDIAAGTDDPSLEIFFNNGDSTFTKNASYLDVYYYLFSILCEDFDNDGDPDLTVTSADGDAVCFFENDGSGNFTHQVDYGTDMFPYDVCTGDYDNDGDLDLIVVNYDVTTISLLWNRYELFVDVDDWTEPSILPVKYELGQNYPNPFNPVTAISYSLKERSHVTLSVYNILGQQIRTLVDKSQVAGSHTVHWDGKDSDGTSVASGIYFYRIEAGDFINAKKMVLLK